MLNPVAEGVRIHQSEFCQTNTTVVDGAAGVLIVDPGVLEGELAGIAAELAAQGRTVAAGYSTHPHWDHLLWHPALGTAPRYATARGAEAARAVLADPEWKARVAPMIPADIIDRVPLDLFGLTTGLPEGAGGLPWDGPRARLVPLRAHAGGHAALLIDGGVLVAGDILSDVLVPLLDFRAEDPIGDYLGTLDTVEALAGDVAVVIPGHGSVGGAEELRDRIALDRAYVIALREGREPAGDPRLGPDGGLGIAAGAHERQVGFLAQRA